MKRSGSMEALRRVLKKSPSATGLANAGARLMTGPTQQQHLSSRDPGERSTWVLSSLILALTAFGCAVILALPVCETSLADLPGLFVDIATAARHPYSARDNTGALVSLMLCLPPLALLDYFFCRRVMPNAGSRWFLLHAIGNMVVAALSLPAFAAVYRNPPAALSVAYCEELRSTGDFLTCSEWPVVIVVSMHIC